jgi:8-oxo-dGTP pyrophosphatase MutT (NUDIX family)
MAPFTSAAGQWVFPCGSPDPDDINSAGWLDLVANVGRELFEETGLDIGVCQVEPGWTLVHDGAFIALIKRVTVNESAERLLARITQHLVDQAQPEFSAVRVVRSPADVDPATPRFYVKFLMAEWS